MSGLKLSLQVTKLLAGESMDVSLPVLEKAHLDLISRAKELQDVGFSSLSFGLSVGNTQAVGHD